MARGQRWNPTKLRALREGLGLSLDQFAAQIGPVTGRTIRRWEAGQHVPYIRHLEAIADAFNVDLGIFFEPRDPSRPEQRSKLPRRSHARDAAQMELLPRTDRRRSPGEK